MRSYEYQLRFHSPSKLEPFVNTYVVWGTNSAFDKLMGHVYFTAEIIDDELRRKLSETNNSGHSSAGE